MYEPEDKMERIAFLHLQSFDRHIYLVTMFFDSNCNKYQWPQEYQTLWHLENRKISLIFVTYAINVDPSHIVSFFREICSKTVGAPYPNFNPPPSVRPDSSSL
jgi:hypothetical protein